MGEETVHYRDRDAVLSELGRLLGDDKISFSEYSELSRRANAARLRPELDAVRATISGIEPVSGPPSVEPEPSDAPGPSFRMEPSFGTGLSVEPGPRLGVEPPVAPEPPPDVEPSAEPQAELGPEAAPFDEPPEEGFSVLQWEEPEAPATSLFEAPEELPQPPRIRRRFPLPGEELSPAEAERSRRYRKRTAKVLIPFFVFVWFLSLFASTMAQGKLAEHVISILALVLISIGFVAYLANRIQRWIVGRAGNEGGKPLFETMVKRVSQGRDDKAAFLYRASYGVSRREANRYVANLRRYLADMEADG